MNFLKGVLKNCVPHLLGFRCRRTMLGPRSHDGLTEESSLVSPRLTSSIGELLRLIPRARLWLQP